MFVNNYTLGEVCINQFVDAVQLYVVHDLVGVPDHLVDSLRLWEIVTSLGDVIVTRSGDVTDSMRVVVVVVVVVVFSTIDTVVVINTLQ